MDIDKTFEPINEAVKLIVDDRNKLLRENKNLNERLKTIKGFLEDLEQHSDKLEEEIKQLKEAIEEHVKNLNFVSTKNENNEYIIKKVRAWAELTYPNFMPSNLKEILRDKHG